MGALAVLVTGMLASAKSGQLRKGGYVDATTQQPMPAFSGTVTGFTGKTLTVESSESNTILFNCSKKTKYYAAEKRIGASEIGKGARVVVEAKMAPDGTLDAVNVRLEPRRGKESAP